MIVKHDDDLFEVQGENGLAKAYLTSSEFWEICRMGARLDAVEEIRDYLTDCDGGAFNMTGEMLDAYAADDDIIEKIIDELLRIRANGETLDDVYDAIDSTFRSLEGVENT